MADLELLGVLRHLLLALFVITTSWIGWGNRFRRIAIQKLNSVFTLDFAELLVDVGLVITYFVLVHRAETVAIVKAKLTTTRPSVQRHFVCPPSLRSICSGMLSRSSPWRKERNEERGQHLGWQPLARRGWVSLLLCAWPLAYIELCVVCVWPQPRSYCAASCRF